MHYVYTASNRYYRKGIARERVMTKLELRPEFELTKFTMYPTLIGELWGVCDIPRQLTGLHCIGMRHDKEQVESILNLLGPMLSANLLAVA